MCGIAGIFCGDRRHELEEKVIKAMAETLAHRGPDGSGLRLGKGYALGHRRLAIVDRAQGAQPMQDGTGNLWVTYNGEIYNHEVLRRQLEARGHHFQTACDTEVLLHGYREWGKELPGHLCGMFAFAIVDEERHELFAARDRLGQKPFYHAEVEGQLVFASELKALLQVPRLERRLDSESLAQYLCLGYVADPRSIFSTIQKLPPASCLLARDGSTRIWTYWQLDLGGGRRGQEPSADLASQQEEFLFLFDQAVRERLMGEVPLGAFLSGGIDSQAVVDSMSRSSDGEVVACTVGFADSAFDERPEARAAALACGARLHEEELRVEDMLELSWFAESFDEPFADDSAVPTYHVSRMARQHVTVALSGDGGDEGFVGYRRYLLDNLENRLRAYLPRCLGSLLGTLYPKLDFLPRWLRYKRTLQALGCEPAEAYARSVSRALPEEILPLLAGEFRGHDPLAPVRQAHGPEDGAHPLCRSARADLATWLPGDILVKVDRASMAVSLEVRSPFLDHRLLEFAATLPAERKLMGGRGKGFLRQALKSRLGAQILERKKQGFSVPLGAWMRGPLGDALEQELSQGLLADILEVPAVRRRLEAHRRGRRDHAQLLWALFVLGRFTRRWLQ